MKSKSRIMYVEDKSKGINGPARIGRVVSSKSGETLHYAGQTFWALRHSGLKANFQEHNLKLAKQLFDCVAVYAKDEEDAILQKIENLINLLVQIDNKPYFNELNIVILPTGTGRIRTALPKTQRGDSATSENT